MLQDVDEIKKSVFEAVLKSKHQSNGITSNIKEALSTTCQQISSLQKENNVVVLKETLYKTPEAAAEIDNDKTDSKERRHSKRKAKHGRRGEKQLAYLKATVSIKLTLETQLKTCWVRFFAFLMILTHNNKDSNDYDKSQTFRRANARKS